MWQRLILALVGCAVSATVPAAALGAASAGDWQSPQALPLSTTTSGALEQGKRHGDEPAPSCAESANAAWYRVDLSRRGAVVVRLETRGGLNAVLSVLRERRSATREVACGATNARGRARVAIWGKKSDVLRIAVARGPKSVAGSFRIVAAQAELPARPPGATLPPAGVRDSVDSFLDVDDAWAVTMRSGVGYRINLVPRRRKDCVSAYLYRPRTQVFDERYAVLRIACRGYALFTPGPDGGGRYTLHLEAAPDVRRAQHYRLQVGRAGRDDVAPGIALRSGAEVSGTLFGRGLDVVDLYQFTVAKPSMFTTVVATRPNVAFDVFVLGSLGHRVSTVRVETPGRVKLHRRLDVGQYTLVLRSRGGSGGRYRLGLSVREVTSTEMKVGGARYVETGFHQPQELAANVQPSGLSGVVRFQLDRFDPLSGWSFYGFVSAKVDPDGSAVATWTPPSMGQWRVGARFMGTQEAATSQSARVRVRVGVPRAELPARPPGQPLPAAGAESSLDAARDADDAWAVDLKEGLSYRLNLLPRSPGDCIAAELYRPGTRAFDPANAVLRLRCGGYGLFTPPPDGGGRYTLRLRAEAAVAGQQPYRLLVGRAGPDDVAPGTALANGDVVRGSVSGEGLDVVDLYTFTAATRSVFDAVVTTRPWVQVDAFVVDALGDSVPLVRSRVPGRVQLHQHLERGVYFVVVRSHRRSHGRYELELSLRVLTTTDLTVGGSRSVETAAGTWQELVATVQPAADGVVRFQLERFDPLAGWQSAGAVFASVRADGVAPAAWLPPSLGQWRVTARFMGTAEVSPSRSESVRVSVGLPG